MERRGVGVKGREQVSQCGGVEGREEVWRGVAGCEEEGKFKVGMLH